MINIGSYWKNNVYSNEMTTNCMRISFDIPKIIIGTLTNMI